MDAIVFDFRRGFYGAFLMDNLELIEQLVTELSQVSEPASYMFQFLVYL